MYVYLTSNRHLVNFKLKKKLHYCLSEPHFHIHCRPKWTSRCNSSICFLPLLRFVIVTSYDDAKSACARKSWKSDSRILPGHCSGGGGGVGR